VTLTVAAPIAPTITSFAPAYGLAAGGTTVVITGANFTGVSEVRFDNGLATNVSVNGNGTEITATTPAGSAGAVVTVTTPGGSGNTISSNLFFRYFAIPTVTRLQTTAGPAAGGTFVTIVGSGFSTAANGTSVTFGGVVADFELQSAEQIMATAPAGSAGVVDVIVTTRGGAATLAGAYTYAAPQQQGVPTVTARSGVAVAFNSTGTAIDLTSSVSGTFSSIAVATAPAHGTTSVSGNVVTFTPTANYYGADSFTFTATGPGGTSAPATVSLTVAGALPQVQPQTGSTGDNQMVSIELTRGATFGPFTAAQVVSVNPSDAVTTLVTSTGTGAARRFFLEATPSARFGGTITIGYTLTNAFGVSPTGVVTLSVAARPDPSNDPKVRALTDAQTQATRRFGRSQIANFMRRNEQLHSGRARSSQNLSVNIIDPTRERRPEDSMASAVMPERDSERAAAEEGKAAVATATDAASTAPTAQDDKPAGVFSSMSMWVSGAIDIATRDEDSFAPKLSATTSGISGGVDFQISKHTAIGFGGGYGNVTSNINAKAVELRATSNLVAVYGSTKLFENGFVDVVAGRGFLDYKTRRRIDGTELTALGSRTGTMNLAAVSFGFNKQVEDLDWSFYSKLEYMDAKLAAYTETSGGSRNNLRLSALDDASYSAGLGFRLQKAYATSVGSFTPRLRGEFGRKFGKSNVQYVDYADIVDAAARSITGRHNEQNYYQTSIGTMIDLKDDWSFDLEYALNYNTATLSTGIKVQVSRAF
jgi:hypothetical protein